MNWNNDIQIKVFEGSHGKFYSIKEPILEEEKEVVTRNDIILYYDIHFPIEWALDNSFYILVDEEIQVGPKYCPNCVEYGFFNGVFIGYCANCASLLEYKKGNGLLPDGLEVTKETHAFDISNIKEENSIWNTYLKDVTIEQIGDLERKEEYEMYKDIPSLISYNK